MSEKQLELYNTISKLPDSLYEKVIDYIKYLEFSIEDIGAPEDLKIKDRDDLITKLKESTKDTDKEEWVDFDSVFEEVDSIFEEQGENKLNEYEVRFSPKSKEDIKDIVGYIKDRFKEPLIAKRYMNLFKDEINKLALFPKKFIAIDEEKIKVPGIRKFAIKNYIVFYRVIEEKRIVSIERILYGASDWEKWL